MREATDLLGRIEALEAELARLKAVEVKSPLSRIDSVVPASHEGASAEPSASRRELLRYAAAALGVAAAAGMAASPAQPPMAVRSSSAVPHRQRRYLVDHVDGCLWLLRTGQRRRLGSTAATHTVGTRCGQRFRRMPPIMPSRCTP
jgi:hypothetical protein